MQLLDSPAAAASVSVRKFAIKLVQRIGLVLLPPQHAGWRYQAGASSLTANLANAGGCCLYNPDVHVPYPCHIALGCCTQGSCSWQSVQNGACRYIEAGSKQWRGRAVSVPVQAQQPMGPPQSTRMGVHLPMVLTMSPAMVQHKRPPWMTLRCQTRWKR